MSFAVYRLDLTRLQSSILPAARWHPHHSRLVHGRPGGTYLGGYISVALLLHPCLQAAPVEQGEASMALLLLREVDHGRL